MKRRLIVRIVLLVLIVALMTTIFILSHQPADVSSEVSGGFIYRVLNFIMSGFGSLSEGQRAEIVDSLQYFVRKCAHAFSYALLGGLLMGLMATFDYEKLFKATRPAFAIAFLYSVTDEVHQLFVEGRSGQVSDVLLDSAGAVCGILIVMLCVFWGVSVD